MMDSPNDRPLSHSRSKAKAHCATLLAAMTPFLAQPAAAVEILSAQELASHCIEFPQDNSSLDGEFCARYIQGFIDGAVATDARVMLRVEAEQGNRQTLSDRAMGTRAPNREEVQRAARYAEFCLGDPVPLREVVLHVVDDLNEKGELSPNVTARSIVYAALRENYPCEAE